MEGGRVSAGGAKGVEELPYFSKRYRVRELNHLLAYILLINLNIIY